MLFPMYRQVCVGGPDVWDRFFVKMERQLLGVTD
jgi:hypothetical protein